MFVCCLVWLSRNFLAAVFLLDTIVSPHGHSWVEERSKRVEFKWKPGILLSVKQHSHVHGCVSTFGWECWQACIPVSFGGSTVVSSARRTHCRRNEDLNELVSTWFNSFVGSKCPFQRFILQWFEASVDSNSRFCSDSHRQKLHLCAVLLYKSAMWLFQMRAPVITGCHRFC